MFAERNISLLKIIMLDEHEKHSKNAYSAPANPQNLIPTDTPAPPLTIVTIFTKNRIIFHVSIIVSAQKCIILFTNIFPSTFTKGSYP